MKPEGWFYRFTAHVVKRMENLFIKPDFKRTTDMKLSIYFCVCAMVLLVVVACSNEAVKEEAPKTEILSRKISALKFAYFNPQENSWQAQWSKDSVLPVLVKIDLSIGPGGKGAENVGLEKYVDIMSAQQIDSVKNDQF